MVQEHRNVLTQRTDLEFEPSDGAEVQMVEENKWTAMITSDPEHSERYAQRFRDMTAEGRDLHGEARFVDAMVGRNSCILDAGCGPGRVGAFLHERGHHVVGVDLDPVLIAAAEQDHPGPQWLVGDLAELDLAAHGIDEGFDAIISAGNVVTFLASDTRRSVLSRLGAHLTDEGRLVIGFGAERDYEFSDFREDVAAARLTIDIELSTWDLQPFNDESDFLVAIISRA